MKARRHGLTLIELLVVIGIIALLVGLLLPILARARVRGRAAVCLSNLRQMSIASVAYSNVNKGRLPLSFWTTLGDETRNKPTVVQCWDLTTIARGSEREVVPGLLWQGESTLAIQQCPEFDGKANWLNDPFTGYNYNTTFLGGGQGEARPAPAKLVAVGDPATTVSFGDGEYSSGANKFMRAPRKPEGGNSKAAGGTQGFRHFEGTNVAFVDGHAGRMEEWFGEYDFGNSTRTLADRRFGFLGADNSLYDLE